jgi:hypothetical protein
VHATLCLPSLTVVAQKSKYRTQSGSLFGHGATALQK